MVMEAPPSPQCVGREFVRQYYTLLNQAPAHLHRFYNNNSSFVHGGLDAPNRETKPVVGQKQIHQKIQQLNFRDCHAKISQVDSQATLGNGVVVQVTGELSNSGQPMRRFTQTFVLAAQSPKKYYVHNDIFRYQDMMFSDEEVEQDSGHSAAEEDVEPEHSPTVEVIPQTQPLQTQQQYYNSAPAVVATAVQQAQPQPVVPPVAVVNGSAHPEEVLSTVPTPTPVPAATPVVVAVSIQPTAPTPVVAPPEEEEPEPEVIGEEELEEEEETGWGDETEVGMEEEKEKSQPEGLDESHHLNDSASSEPKTYATLVKSGGIGGVGTASFASTISTTPVKPTNSPVSDLHPGVTYDPPMAPRITEQRDGMQMSGLSSGTPGGMGQGQRGARSRGGAIRGMVRPDRGGPGRGNFSEDTGSVGGDGDRRRMGPNTMQQYADDQQLFMGNLPLHATEEELKELFSKFGPIIDLRIHSKQNAKGMSGNRVPNYGFIIFEHVSTVQHVLSSRPIYFPNENGQKLNVEEKKTRTRSMDGGRMGSGGDTMMRPSSGLGGPRGGGPGGMMRGGPGMGHHRGGGRGGFSRGDGRGGGMNRGGYTRR